MIRSAVGGLTVSSGQVTCVVHKFDLLLIQTRQSSQILIFAIFGKWVNTLVAVVKMRKKNVRPFSHIQSASASTQQRKASYLGDIL
jgi:hypothetical protein